MGLPIKSSCVNGFRNAAPDFDPTTGNFPWKGHHFLTPIITPVVELFWSPC